MSRPSPPVSDLQFTDCIGKLIQHPSGPPSVQSVSSEGSGDRPEILPGPLRRRGRCPAAPYAICRSKNGGSGYTRPNWVARTRYLLYPEARLANRTRLSDARRCTGGFVLGGIVVGLVSRLLIAEQIWDTLVPNRGL